MQSKTTILIIDDDNRNIFALSAVLKSRGYDCLTASGMEEAFVELRAGKSIDVILIDMMMPEMDGYEAIGHIHGIDKYKNVPIIAVTAQAMPGDREKSINAGADDYISKPVDMDILFNLLQRYRK
ncbi:response regulator [Pollutibacter soli]|uniref:response regulator n=1 Tax=Pollutibacter soli TaxID=3034157 RepID=UPI003013C828